MGGWHPERLPVLMAMYEFEHVDALPDLLLTIRSEARKAQADG